MERGTTKAMKTAGEHLVVGHAGLDAMCREISPELGITLPNRASPQQEGFVAAVDAESGREFDSSAVNIMRVTHGQIFPAIAKIRASTKNTLVRQLADLANDTVLDHITVLEKTGLVEYDDVTFKQTGPAKLPREKVTPPPPQPGERVLVLKPRPDLADVPVSIESLVKEYAGGYRAVDDVTFRVERGQVVGLLGPNGAGKTTALRVLVGLITPTSGRVHVFGQPVVPGAPVLARVGAFIEGPGFLPHLTGRENLRLFWAATGRPEQDAQFDLALDIAGLGPSIDRRVRAYSHGMKQRLGIAQAMLGLPEVLVLDEPTNGLDPPQIAEMREVLQDYARTGRTVLVSSHLLAEVEQTCTHIVVMHKGRLIAAGPTGEIAGAGGLQLSVDVPEIAARVLAEAGITAALVPARRALEDVFLDMIGEGP
jgi:ABC-type multidrug transport system ATPase subunit